MADFQAKITKVVTFETPEKYPGVEIQAEVVPVDGGVKVPLKFTEMVVNLQGMTAEQAKAYIGEQIKAYYRLQESKSEVDPVTKEWKLTPDIQGVEIPLSI